MPAITNYASCSTTDVGGGTSLKGLEYTVHRYTRVAQEFEYDTVRVIRRPRVYKVHA